MSTERLDFGGFFYIYPLKTSFPSPLVGLLLPRGGDVRGTEGIKKGQPSNNTKASHSFMLTDKL